jgi:hypothetical protein
VLLGMIADEPEMVLRVMAGAPVVSRTVIRLAERTPCLSNFDQMPRVAADSLC